MEKEKDKLRKILCEDCLKTKSLKKHSEVCEKNLNDLIQVLDNLSAEKEKVLRNLDKKSKDIISTKEKLEAFCLLTFDKFKEYCKFENEYKLEEQEKIAVERNLNTLILELTENLDSKNELLKIVQLEFELAKGNAEDGRKVLISLKNKLAELQDENIKKTRILDSLQNAYIESQNLGKTKTKNDKLRLIIKEESQYLHDLLQENEKLREEIERLENYSNDIYTDDTIYEESEYKELAQKVQDQQADLLRVKLNLEKRKETSEISNDICKSCTIY